MIERRQFFDSKPEETGALESTDYVHMGRIRPSGPSAIEFRRKARSWFSFPYSYLVAVEYAPNGADSERDEEQKPHVAAYFSGHKVRIFGSNLIGIYHGIRGGTLESVAEMDQSEVMAAEDGSCIVDAIWIEEV